MTSNAKEQSEAGWRLLTVAQVAEMLSLSRSTVYELVVRGELQAFKVGRSVRIPRDAVRSLLDKSRL